MLLFPAPQRDTEGDHATILPEFLYRRRFDQSHQLYAVSFQFRTRDNDG